MLKKTLLPLILICTGFVLLSADDNSTVMISGDHASGTLEYSIGQDQVDDVNMDGINGIGYQGQISGIQQSKSQVRQSFFGPDGSNDLMLPVQMDVKTLPVESANRLE